MAANTVPIFPLIARVDAVNITAGNTSSSGAGTIGTDIFLVGSAGADGTMLGRIRFMPFATVAGTATTATVARVFLSTQSSGATTVANTHLVGEIALTSQTADSSTIPVVPNEIPLGFPIPSGMSILATTHVAPAASTGWKAMFVNGGNY